MFVKASDTVGESYIPVVAQCQIISICSAKVVPVSKREFLRSFYNGHLEKMFSFNFV